MLAAWSTALPALTRLELLGPFLVRAPAWEAFFAARPGLTGLLITQSPRFNHACMKGLADHCPGLRELRLKEVGLLNDDFAVEIAKLNNLELLDLADPTTSLSEDALCALIEDVGPRLATLDLSGHAALTDTFLTSALLPHAAALRTLRLVNLPELTDAGVAALFDGWRAAHKEALAALDLSRSPALGPGGAALRALLRHSGPALERLHIGGWKEVPEDALGVIPQKARGLVHLDVGWCREVDDFFVKAVLDGCERVKEVKVWGCSRVTMSCPRKVRPRFHLLDSLNEI